MAKYIEFSGLKSEQFQVKTNLKNVLQSVNYCAFCLEGERDLFWLKDFSRFDKDINFCTLEWMVKEIFEEKILNNVTSDYICSLCKENIEQTYIFISKVRKTFKILSNFLNQIDMHITDVANMLTESNEDDFASTVVVLQDTEDDKVIPFCNNDTDFDDTSQYITDTDTVEGTEDNFIKEEKEAVTSNNYVCEHCYQIFKSKDTLFYHIAIMHKRKPHMKQAKKSIKKELCFECKTVHCVHEKYLQAIDMYNQQDSTAYIKCIDCDYVCLQKMSLLAHVNKIHLNICPYLCESCGESFHSRPAHYWHMKSVHNQLTNMCQYCDVEYNDKNELLNHISHCKTVTREYKCDTCEASFDEPLQLSVHLENHISSYTCHVCLKTFDNETRFNKHRARAHTKVQSKVHFKVRKSERQCSICAEKFSSLAELRYHVALHGPEEKHKCLVCDLDFDTRQSYQKHIRSSKHVLKIDPNARLSIRCPHCDYSCETGRYLEHHLNVVHFKVKPHVCDVCRKSFTTKSNLKSHLELHKGVKKHICKQCDSRFSTTTGLKKHVLNVHCDEKPLACDQCDKSFVYMSEYELHKLRSHSLCKQVACPLCDSRFTTISNVRRHIISVHVKGQSIEDFMKTQQSSELAELLRDRRLPVIET